MKKIEIDIEKIVECTNKATPAPWISIVEGRDQTSGSSFIMTGGEEHRDYDIEICGIRIEDQDFIAMARNVLPDLIHELVRLRKILNDSGITY